LRKKSEKKETQQPKKSPQTPSSYLSSPVRPKTVSPSEAVILKDLPFSYGETKFVLMVRDPYWAFSYWDFSADTWSEIQKKFSENPSFKPVIRIFDLDKNKHYDLLISLEARNWYLHLGIPDHRYVAELGLSDGRSHFYRIARSNEVRTPRDSPSQEVDPKWSDRDFEEICRLSLTRGGVSSSGSFSKPS